VGPDEPLLTADDLGLTRGDGCFEATRVVTDTAGGHRIDHLEDHLDRLQASAAALALPDIDRDAWRALIDDALSGWDAVGEAMLKLILTRGRESDPSGEITGIVTVTPIAAQVLEQRRNGVSVVTLSRGTASDAAAPAPWLLGGVKTLSYAVNVAAVRVAQARGADDVIFTSSDGYVLEGPTAAVVWQAGGSLITTPVGPTGILASITQRALFAAAEQAGKPTAYALGTPAELSAADGVWLVSSGRGVAQVHTINGNPLSVIAGLSQEITALAGF
jgi:4-amino-4-deoxychorismate lyase